MNCGCVVVGYTGGGAKEFMRAGKTALVSEDGDCVNAAENLKRLLEDSELKERIRENGFKLARSYTLERTENVLNDFYKKIIN